MSKKNVKDEVYTLSPTAKAMFQAGFNASEIMAHDMRKMQKFAMAYMMLMLKDLSNGEL